MGYAITWCAVREEDADAFLQSLGLVATGATEEIPDSRISSGRLDTGWRVLWYNEYDCPFLRPTDLRRLSADRDVLLCRIEEHVMASSAEWAAEGGDDADVDYLFEIPLKVAQGLVGFKHDEDSPHLVDGAFGVLHR